MVFTHVRNKLFPVQSPPKRILLIQLGDLGDLVVSFPCIRALKETYPEASVYVAVHQKAAELIDLCPWASGAIIVEERPGEGMGRKIKRQFDFITHLRSHNFDMAIDLRAGDRGAILAFLSGAGKRYTAYYGWNLLRSLFFTRQIKLHALTSPHMVDFNLDILSAFNIATGQKNPEAVVPAEKRQQLRALLLKEGVPRQSSIVAIQPFSLWPYKEWGDQKFIELIAWIRAEFDLPVIVTGSLQEQARAGRIVEGCNGQVYNFAGKTSLAMFAALLEACRLMIGVDSSGAHIAAAVGTPTVTIYGPASPQTWAPRGPKNRIVQKGWSCVPCNRTGCEGSKECRCLKELEVSEVKQVVDKLLSEIM